MASTHGSGAVFKLDNYGGSLVALSAYCDTAAVAQSADTAEDTAFSADSRPAKGYLPGLKDGTIAVGGPWDAVLDRQMDMVFGRTGTFEVGPDGGASGDARYTGEAILTEYTVNVPVGDKMSWSGTLQTTGGITKNTY